MHYRVLSEIYRELVKSSSVVLGNLNIGFKLLLGISYRFGKAYEEIPRGVDDHVALFASVYAVYDLFHNSFSALIGGISYNVFTVYKLSRSLTRFKSSVKSCRLFKLSLAHEYSGSARDIVVVIGSSLCHSADLILDSRAQIAVGKSVSLVCKLFSCYIGSISAVAEYDELFGVKLSYLVSACVSTSRVRGVATVIKIVISVRIAGCQHGNGNNKRQDQRDKSESFHFLSLYKAKLYIIRLTYFALFVNTFLIAKAPPRRIPKGCLIKSRVLNYFIGFHLSSSGIQE